MEPKSYENKTKEETSSSKSKPLDPSEIVYVSAVAAIGSGVLVTSNKVIGE